MNLDNTGRNTVRVCMYSEDTMNETRSERKKKTSKLLSKNEKENGLTIDTQTACLEFRFLFFGSCFRLYGYLVNPVYRIDVTLLAARTSYVFQYLSFILCVPHLVLYSIFHVIFPNARGAWGHRGSARGGTERWNEQQLVFS